jgi:type II secretory pathway pseudopilin PulG
VSEGSVSGRWNSGTPTCLLFALPYLISPVISFNGSSMKLFDASVPVRSARRGFTLFEVSISLALVAFGVVSVLMVLPTGIKAQQMARYQILASAMAMEMIDQFTSSPNANQMMDREGVNPWDTYSSYRASSPDLETRLSNSRSGLYPIPLDIARRIDSDGDEIAQILQRGGYLYYMHPLAALGFNEFATRANMPLPNESQRMVCAVVGYAQQNALTSNPWKDWPYYAAYPSPPMHGIYKFGSTDGVHASAITTTPINFGYYDNSAQGTNILLLENTLPADKGDMGILFRSIIKNTTALPLTSAWVDDPNVAKLYHRCSGYFSYGESGWILDCDYDIRTKDDGSKVWSRWSQKNPDGQKANNIDQGKENDKQPEKLGSNGTTGPNNPVYKQMSGARNRVTMKELSRESAIAYFALAYWYAEQKKTSANLKNGVILNYDRQLLTINELFVTGLLPEEKNIALAVNAARFLAHAAMCLTAHLPLDATGLPDSTANIPLNGNFEVFDPADTTAPPSKLIKRFTIGGGVMNLKRALTYAENSLQLAMRYASTYPYDFGAPRPLNRAIMTDFPLLQYDPFGGLVRGDTSFNLGQYYTGNPPTASALGLPPITGVSAPYQWRITGAQPITNIGRSFSYPKIDLKGKELNIRSEAGTNGGSRFTLTQPFEGADRCRQLVFYAVDWQSYEDFETAPSAPVDASRFPKWAPFEGKSTVDSIIKADGSSFNDAYNYTLRNPEKTILFTEPSAGAITGAELNIIGLDIMWQSNPKPIPDRGKPTQPAEAIKAKTIFSGLYGADRNFNGSSLYETGSNNYSPKGKLDRGPVPKSVRMRASVIARFNFYDPRLPLVVR